ncbi:AAA family ATPase [Gaopeijia maritima]|uniref:AAA family ATPase n=1 Tax=Gaopeijia maritima TaxID=3119007 RepID=UPI0032723CE5
MRLRSLRLKNWRSFEGEHEIEFAWQTGRSLTVFVGQNGAGKTALLNAFTWCLFEDTTAGFRRDRDLFNHAALERTGNGEGGKMEVELRFEHEGGAYRVCRSQSFRRDNEGELSFDSAQLSASRTHFGATTPLRQEEVEAVLPRGLHPFFFFPAESIGRDLSESDGVSVRASMSTAIDTLLGIGRLDRALDIISGALGKHLRPKKGAGDSKLQEAAQKAERARSAWEETQRRVHELPDEIRKAERLEESTKQRLEETDAEQEAVEQFRRLETEIEGLDRRLIGLVREERRLINEGAIAFFSDSLFEDSLEVLDAAHQNGEIPPKISAGLLDELLDNRAECICGRPLTDRERDELGELRKRVVADRIAELGSALRSRIPDLLGPQGARKSDRAIDALLALESERLEDEQRRTFAEAEKGKLLDGSIDLERGRHAAELRDAWARAYRVMGELRAEYNRLSRDLGELEAAKRATEGEAQKLLARSESAAAVGRARALLSEAEVVISDVQKAIRENARADVEREVNRLYRQLVEKPYVVRLDEDFKYQIVDETTNRPVGVSSSEIALATFAFVGALARLMPVYSDLESFLPVGDGDGVGNLDGDPDRAYPIVLDAPYSPFGQVYSERFSGLLPMLLPQSVLIVRPDQVQFLGSLLDGDAPPVGRAYLLQLYSSKAESAGLLDWRGSEYAFVVRSDTAAPPKTQIISLSV